MSPHLTCQTSFSLFAIQISNRIYFLIFHSWLQVGYKPTTPFSYHQYLTFHSHFTIHQNNIAWVSLFLSLSIFSFYTSFQKELQWNWKGHGSIAEDLEDFFSINNFKSFFQYLNNPQPTITTRNLAFSDDTKSSLIL